MSLVVLVITCRFALVDCFFVCSRFRMLGVYICRSVKDAGIGFVGLIQWVR